MIYTIKQGQHYCEQTRVEAHDGKISWTVRAMLGEDCLYNLNSKKYNQQSNKLEGRGYGLNHHQDSVRVAWRPVFDSTTWLVPQNKFGILAYYYNKGTMYAKSMFQVQPNEWFEYTVTCDRVNNTLTYTSPKLKVPKIYYFDWSNVPVWGYKLYFYFGGDKTYPKNMDMEMNYL